MAYNKIETSIVHESINADENDFKGFSNINNSQVQSGVMTPHYPMPSINLESISMDSQKSK